MCPSLISSPHCTWIASNISVGAKDVKGHEKMPKGSQRQREPRHRRVTSIDG